jgi:S-adenosylmethionine synthetase
VDLAVARQPRALVGVEVAVHRGMVFVSGRVAGAGLRMADVEAIVRERYASLGHGPDWPPDPAVLAVVCDLDTGPLLAGESDFREVSDDQSICTGYAVDSPETGWLPPEHWLAHRVVRGLEMLRRDSPELRLGPDAKSAVLGAEQPGRRMGLEAATVSLQQAVGADEIATRRRVVDVVRGALAAAPAAFEVPTDLALRVLVNGAGNFECGGPMGDNGLSGKKLVADAYGPRVPIGGGALSGKDFFKVDRAGAIAARRLALAIVHGGGSHEATVELLWRPGDREARVAAVTGPDGAAIDPAPWLPEVDLSPRGSGNRWPRLVRGRMQALATGGHFGAGQPWEQ